MFISESYVQKNSTYQFFESLDIDEDEKEGITDDDWLDLDKSLSEQKEKIKGKKEKVQKKVSGTKSEIQKLEEAIVALTKEIKE